MPSHRDPDPTSDFEQEPLARYLSALRSGDAAARQQLRGGWPDLADGFDAVDRAWSRIAPLERRLAGTPSLEARLRSRFGASVDPGIQLDSRLDSRAEPADAADRLADRLGGANAAGRAGRYRRRGEIARGGMGSIQRVWDDDLRRHLVMKVMLRPKDRDPESTRAPDPRVLSRFLEEAQITSQLDHPGILPVHDIGIDEEGRLYFTMPLVQGQDLGTVIDAARTAREGWNTTRVLGVLLKVAEAMAYAHERGVVHRDLKPENVMVGRFGETYVMDWGLARVVGREDEEEAPKPERRAEDPESRALRGVATDRSVEADSDPNSPIATLDGDVIGTPGYMAPEQARGRRSEIGPRSDVYALGAVLYQLLTGFAPFNDPVSRSSGKPLFDRILELEPVPIRKLAPTVPTELVAIAQKAMERDPDDRYPGMLELAEDLRAFLEGRVVRAYEQGVLAEARKWFGRNKLVASTIVASVLLLVVSAVALITQQQRNLERLQDEQGLTAKALDEAEEARSEAIENARIAAEREAEAAREAERAELAAASAETQRQIATQLAAQAEQARKDAESAAAIATRRGYATNLLAAEVSLRAGDLAEARRRLDAAAPELRGWEWDHLRQRTDMSLRRYPGPDLPVLGVAYGEDDLLAAVDAQTLRTYDVDSEQALETWPAPFLGDAVDPFVALAREPFDPDRGGDPRVAVATRSGRVLLYTPGIAEPSELGPGFASPIGPPTALAWSPTGDRLAVAREQNDGHTVRVLSTAGGSTAVVERALSPVTALAFTPDGERLAAAQEDGAVQVASVTDTSQPVLPLLTHREAVTDLAFSSEGGVLATASEDRQVVLWDVAGGTILGTVNDREAVTAVAFAPDDQSLATGSADGAVRLWDARTRGLLAELRGHEGAVRDLSFGASGRDLVSASDDGDLCLWDAASGSAVSTIELESSLGVSLTFDGTGDRLLAFLRDVDSTGVVWDAVSLEPLARFASGPDAYLEGTRIDFVEDGAYLVGIGGTGGGFAPTVWDSATGRVLPDGGSERLKGSVLQTVTDPLERWFAAVFRVDEGDDEVLDADRVARGELEEDGSMPTRTVDRWRFEVRLWTFPDGPVASDGEGASAARAAGPSELARFVGWPEAPEGRSNEAVTELAAHPTGQLLATGHESGQVRLWGVDPPGLRRRLVPPAGVDGEVHALAFDPWGDRLAAAIGDRILLWDAARGTLLAELAGHEGRVTSLAFLANGDRLLSGSVDRSLRIWDPQLGESLAVLRGHSAPVLDVTASPDGLRVASVDRDGEVRLWETSPPLERYEARRRAELLRRDANPLLLAMLDEYVTQTAVIEAIQADRTLAEPIRQKMLQYARMFGENPTTLHGDAWAVVRERGLEPEAYRFALAKARAAEALRPGDGILLRTLGIAYFRCGDDAQALATLKRSAAQHRRGPRPEELAVMAMAAARSGRELEALGHLGRMQELMSNSRWARDGVARDFQREALVTSTGELLDSGR